MKGASQPKTTRKRPRLLLAIACLASFLLVGGTFAAWAVQSGPVFNVISTGILKGELIVSHTDDLDNPPVFEPGVPYERIVEVKNTGNLDMLARVKLEKVWGDGSRDGDGKLIPVGLETSNIVITPNTNVAENDKWVYDGEYYYYKGVLRKGDVTAQPLFEEYMLDKQGTTSEYQKKVADIDLSLECLQYAGGAIKEVWGHDYAFLGIAPPAWAPSTTPAVTFVSPGDAFSFNAGTADFLASFGEMVPGEKREQKMVMTNSYNTPVEILLRAEQGDQSFSEPVKEILQKFAWLTVKDESGNILYDNPVWNYPNAPVSDSSTGGYISLGSFDAGASKTLTMTLALAPDDRNDPDDPTKTLAMTMDNRYQLDGEEGRVRWRFMATGEDTTSRPPDESSGGGGGGGGGEGSGIDYTNIGSGSTPLAEAEVPLGELEDMPIPLMGVTGTTVLWVTGLVASAWILGFLFVPWKRRKKEQEYY